MIVGAIAIVTMVFDYLQYFCGYWNADTLREKMEIEKKEEGDYDYEACSYKLRKLLFWIKQISLGIGVIWFFFVLFKYFFF